MKITEVVRFADWLSFCLCDVFLALLNKFINFQKKNQGTNSTWLRKLREKFYNQTHASGGLEI